MKPPFPYYGGKQMMLPHILPLIPEHNLYAEPFCGGASVFWAKPPSPIEVLNDLNGEIANFYSVVKNEAESLNRLIQATLHSRRTHQFANCVYEFPEEFTPVRRAWALWVLATQSMFSDISNVWALDKPNAERPTARTGKSVNGKRILFGERTADDVLVYADRLRTVQVDNTDALRIIKTRDTETSFFYIDPPYFNSDCGHYRGYSVANFVELLELLSTIKGKFLLSQYDSDVLRDYAKRHGWTIQTFDKNLSAGITSSKDKGRRKTECLIYNYETQEAPR